MELGHRSYPATATPSCRTMEAGEVKVSMAASAALSEEQEAISSWRSGLETSRELASRAGARALADAGREGNQEVGRVGPRTSLYFSCRGAAAMARCGSAPAGPTTRW